MTTEPSSDRSEPPGGVRAGLSPKLLTASRLIIGAQDGASLAAAFAQILALFDIDLYVLSKIHDNKDRYVTIIAASDRLGGAPVRPGEAYPMRVTPIFAAMKPDAPFLIEDYHRQELEVESDVMRGFLKKFGVRAFSVFPLVEGSEVRGFMSLYYYAPRPRSEEEVQALCLIAQLTSVTLSNIESRAKLAKKMKQLRELYRISEMLDQLTEEETLFQAAAELIADKVEYSSCWFAVVDEEAGTLRQVGHAGVGIDESTPAANLPLSDHRLMVVATLRSGHPAAYSQMQERAEAEGWGGLAKASKLNSGVIVPLRAGGEALGVMAIGSAEPVALDDEVSLLGAFGNQLASTIARLRMDKERSQKVAELEAAYAHQARLLETVRELSTPAIPVHDGVLVLPLVGTVDSSRSAQLMESLLYAIQKERASVVILDITGVPAVDTGVANHVLRSVRAAALLGARCVLVGVSPAVARTLAQIGVDLGDLVTRRDLQSGISYALGVLGRAGSA